MSDYGKLTPREIDALVATRVFGKPYPAELPDSSQADANEFAGGAHSYKNEGFWFASTTGYENGDKPCWDCRAYSTDDNAARLLRDRIQELGLEKDVIQLLESALKLVRADDWDSAIWIYMQASPRDLCIASLKARDLWQSQ